MLVPIHVAAGGLAMVLGAAALLAKKGGTIHRRSGLLFVYAMVVLGISAAMLGNVLGGFMTVYFVGTALTTVRPVSSWTRLINVADVGKPINPKIVETQLSGASLMQLGFSMFEKMHIDGGQVTNASLADYKIPGIHDVPPVMENEAVDTNQGNGPFGAKGVGELGTFGVSPAIANAIDDAVGVRLTELPLTAEAVFRALRARDNKPLGDE